MNKKARTPLGMIEVEATRLTTDDSRAAGVVENCGVAIEGPVTIDVDGTQAFTVLCTPDDKRAMAVGFLFSEGIIDSISDIALLNECEDDPNVIRVRLSESAPNGAEAGRNLLIVSSCGMCGSESMEEKLRLMPKVGNALQIEKSLLIQVAENVRKRQVIFEKSGGTHAIGIFDKKGELKSFAEDIGRHNALDKAIGKCLLHGQSPAGCGASLSGRVSLEMVSKCARAGIEVISAVSAPTSLALEAARRCNITVLGFVRGTRATAFTYPERVID